MARINLREFVSRSRAERVDREKGIIHGAKILGLESRNGRRYTPEAVRKAAKLYEGVPVLINHPRKAGEDRDSSDVFGRILPGTVQVREDGLYADIGFLKSHPMAERVAEAAEKMPDVFGFSHNAMGDGRHENGVLVIHEITEVHSVDLVVDPATTNGLFESERKPMMKKVKDVLAEALVGRKKLVEQMANDELLQKPMEQDMEVPAEMSAEDQAAAAFEAMVLAVLRDTSLDMQGKKSKIAEILKAQDKLMGAGAEEPAAEQDEEKPDEEKPVESKKKNKTADPSVKELQEQLLVRDLIDEAGLKFVRPESRRAFAKSLVSLSEAERKALIEERKAATEQTHTRAAPRSSTAAAAVKESKGPATQAEFAALCFPKN